MKFIKISYLVEKEKRKNKKRVLFFKVGGINKNKRIIVSLNDFQIKKDDFFLNEKYFYN